MANNYNFSPVFLGGQFAPNLGGQYSRFFHSTIRLTGNNGTNIDLKGYNNLIHIKANTLIKIEILKPLKTIDIIVISLNQKL